MCADMLACSHRPHSRLLVSIWPSNKVYHSHWLWASQQATRNYTSVTAYICIILHTQKLLLSYLGSQQWRNERGWIVQAITDDSLLSCRLLRFAVYGEWRNSHVIFKTTTKKKYHRLASSWVRVGPVILTGYKDLWFSGWRILDLTHAAETTAADAHLSLLHPEGFMVPARVHAQLMGISNCVQLALDKIAVTLSL